MDRPRRLSLIVWLTALISALLFVVWVDTRRTERVDFVSRLGDPAVTVSAASPTGYADGRRLLVVPGHNNESYQWIAQTQSMLAEGTWRVRRAEYDNAPIGREVGSPSGYRWWLATVAWLNSFATGQSTGLAVERSALWADPLMQLLILVVASALTLKVWGAPGATLVIFGLVALHPANLSYLPGSPDDYSLIQGTLLAMAMTLLAGVRSAAGASRGAKHWFALSGILGGLGLWLSVNSFAIVLGMLGISAVAVAARRRGEVSLLVGKLPWRAWSLAGGATTLALWLIEYAPEHLEIGAGGLDRIHPLYAVAWLGFGEIVVRIAKMPRGQSWTRDRRALAILLAAVAAVVAIPATMYFKEVPGFLQLHAYNEQLGGSAEGAYAVNLGKWFGAQGVSLASVSVFLSLLLPLAAAWRLSSKKTSIDARAGLALMFAPLFFAFVLGCQQLGWLNQFGMLLLALLPLLQNVETAPSRTAWVGAGSVALLLMPGIFTTVPARLDPNKPEVSRAELESLIERDLAYRLAQRSGPDGAIVLAPPNLAASAIFHGGLRGLGSPYRENEEGFRASVRIAGATSMDEALAIATQRRLTHIIVPSWDDFLSEYARLGAVNPDQTLMGLLKTWLPPRWLRPVAFQLPQIPGFEDQYVAIFEVGEVQDNATVLARLAEYFIEMGRVSLAAQVSKTLAEAFSADLGAQAAQARTAAARKDPAAFAAILSAIESGLQHSADDTLIWDRRVSLAQALALAGRMELARNQAARCAEEMGEYDLRGLSAGELYRFLSLCKTLGVGMPDEEMRRLANSLVPPEYNFRI